ncbi:MAG: hypothetical protein KAI43_12775 [Candidatus Aureabacteria bacterium]|nr:hypothetical protein [Candidatus Auribacterota bacterium]
MEGKKTILYVSHDIEDGAWQFLTGEIPKEEEARILLLEEIVELDPSVSELADLPMGWFAERQNKNEPWSRTKKE